MVLVFYISINAYWEELLQNYLITSLNLIHKKLKPEVVPKKRICSELETGSSPNKCVQVAQGSRVFFGNCMDSFIKKICSLAGCETKTE